MSELSKITVLVVDDERLLRDLLSRILERVGYRVTVAESGAGALEVLAERQIDVVITDITMPEMSGLELLSEVKKRFPKIPVIVMTAFADTYTIKDVLLQGADEYITKPFKDYEATMVVERACWRLLSNGKAVEKG